MKPRASSGWGVLAVLVALVALVHVRGLASDLVYDGLSQIGEDDYIHQPRHLGDVLTLRVLGQDVLDGNRPTQLLSLMLDALVWHRRPFGFHLTNLLLHLGCVLLLFAWLRRLGADQGPAGFAAALFAVHPLVVEVVAEPSYREDLLVGLLLLLALRLAQDWGGSRRPADVARFVAVVLCSLGAVGAKESGIAVVPLLLVAEGLRPAGARRPQAVWLLGAVAVVTGAFLLARFAWQPDPSEMFPVRPVRLGGSLAATAVIQLRIFALYLKNMVWPARLSADYTPGAIAGIPQVVALLAVLLLLALQVLLVRRARRPELAWQGGVWFWATLLPASNLLPMYRPAADRYLYVPLMGAVALLAAALSWVWPRPLARTIALTALGAAVLAGSVASIARHQVFSSELALWQDTLRASPDSTTALDNHAWALLDAHQLPEAQAEFARAVAATQSHDPDPLAGRAIALFERGQIAEARADLQAAISLDPLYGQPARLQRSLRLTRAQLQRLRAIDASSHSREEP